MRKANGFLKGCFFYCPGLCRNDLKDEDKGKADCQKHPSKFNEWGFSLVELIITMAILAIIIVIATPTLLTQFANMEAKRIRHTLQNILVLAKAESLSRHQNLIVCLADDKGHCDKDNNQALVLFADQNDNHDFDVGYDELIEEQTLRPKYGTLHLRAAQRDYVKFYGDSGKPRGHFGHIKYCTNSVYSQIRYQISFNQLGIIKYKPNDSHPTGC